MDMHNKAGAMRSGAKTGSPRRAIAIGKKKKSVRDHMMEMKMSRGGR
jgi:hypothetical protein